MFPATRHEPSEARLIERIGVSPAGVYSAHIVSAELRFERDYIPIHEYKYSRIDPIAWFFQLDHRKWVRPGLDAPQHHSLGNLFPWMESRGTKFEHTWSLVIVISVQVCASEAYLASIVNAARENGSKYRRSQILIVPSSLPVTSHLPSLWKETEVTFELWPSKTISCREIDSV